MTVTTAKRRVALRRRQLRDAKRELDAMEATPQEGNRRWLDRLGIQRMRVLTAEQQLAEAEREVERLFHEQ